MPGMCMGKQTVYIITCIPDLRTNHQLDKKKVKIVIRSHHMEAYYYLGMYGFSVALNSGLI